MPKLSLYNAVSALLEILDNLEHVLRKSETNAKDRKIDPQIFMNARLAPDMYPLVKQVQNVASLAKTAPYRISGQTPPVYEETEETFQDMYDLIAKAKADIAKVDRSALDGQENYKFTVKLGSGDVDFTGSRYLSGFILPNIYFHYTTAYNILRHNGVPLGKLDFFGGRK